MDDYYQLFSLTDNTPTSARAKRDQMVNNSDEQDEPALNTLLEKLKNDALFSKLTVFLDFENSERTSNDAERTNRDTRRRQQQQHYRYRKESSNARAIENATVLRGISKSRRLLKRGGSPPDQRGDEGIGLET